jgi:NADH dehydrogenase (ubiquinone) Fe-S protein 1
MIKVYVNNKEVLVPKNTSALEACETIGVQIPRFCYHERLNVAGNCRMCLVEIEKAPKPIAACAFPVAPNMRIYTDTPLVKKARENVMEFLLVNHPLDCPICDQGGECDLQEQAMIFGSDRSRFFYTKRAVEDKNCGPLVKTIMTRCIHCTRCVRFFQDIAGQEDFGTTLRGRETEIGTYIGKNLNSELSGNIIDLCPVGALTSKPYAFAARPWEIKNIETIDVNDSIGSNIKVNFKETEILRILPSLNDTLNEEWISDKTRFSFDALKIQRVGTPFIKNKLNHLEKTTWKIALEKNNEKFSTLKPEQILFVCGNNTDLETVNMLKTIAVTKGVNLITEEYSNINTNLTIFGKCNTNFTDILNSDLCLTVGTNIRFEASLLNVRLRKRLRNGNFIKASIGLTENNNHATDSIGNSLQTLLSIAEGRHIFCQKLVKANKPFIIIGSSVLKRADAKIISSLLVNISKYAYIVQEDWLGINFLPLTSNKVGVFVQGISNMNKENLKAIKYVYGVGLDNVDNLLEKLPKEDVFVTIQTAFASSGLKKANLVLPSTAFTEKEGTFINLEGRAQKTKVVMTGPALARDDKKIISALFSKKLSLNEDCVYNYNFTKNRYNFTKNLLKKNYGIKKLTKTGVKPVISNFFSSNIISKNSIIMAKCAAIFKKNFSNFI